LDERVPAAMPRRNNERTGLANLIWMGHDYDIQCGAPKIAFSWFITPITMVYGTQITIVMGVYKPTNITGGPHIVF
jgi:hypothetical protein